MVTRPMAAVSAVAEPETPLKNIEASTMAAPSPPGIRPTEIWARSIRRLPSPLPAMIVPAKMNRGIVSSGKLLRMRKISCGRTRRRSLPPGDR